MALEALDARHAAQIEAGTRGRRSGHSFEALVAESVNALKMPFERGRKVKGCLTRGNLGEALLNLVLYDLKMSRAGRAGAISAGALATAEAGKPKEVIINGVRVKRCKSDVILILEAGGKSLAKGVSIKQCSNPKPTNAQVYLSTARAFCELLRRNGMQVSDRAVEAMRMFCGDAGFRPLDNPSSLKGRRSDPRRWFWEELPPPARAELEQMFSDHQNLITRLLLQKAYSDDPFAPDYIIHQTCAIKGGEPEFAILTINDFIKLSEKYAGFELSPYSVKKGSYVDPPGVMHLAPRFGVIQFQKFGPKQNATQLQFNLKAGYFYRPPFSGKKAEVV
jgi:hypothetical protein